MERNTAIFGQVVTLKNGTPSTNGRLNISAVSSDGSAWSQLFSYDPTDQIMEPDKEKLNDLIDICRKKSKARSIDVLRAVSEFLILFGTVLMRIIGGFVSSFVGFGFVGIILMLGLIILGGTLALYVALAMLPLALLSLGLKYIRDKSYQEAAKFLTQEALAFVSEE